MQVRDLRRESPRRWNEELDGVAWLPRLIDKARSALRGTLGTYLYGQSPVDRDVLHVLGIGHRAFAEIVAAACDDRAVVAALLARDPGCIERGRAWTRNCRRIYGSFFYTLDVDDGYAPGMGFLKPFANGLSAGITWLMKRIYPKRPTEGITTKW
ncbi:MAG TPA: DUF5069 domain-containing protein [Alphaproteobacteria bacterium]|nr:DUF5069 domain-containing protein [Alphaproteobacteria bacterium]